MVVVSTAAQGRACARIRFAIVSAALMIGITRATLALADDMSTITSRVQSQLLGNAPSTSTVQGYMNTQQANGSWTDIDYTSHAQTNWVPLTHVQRMAAMAEVWGNPNSSLYHGATLAADLRSAMDYWFTFTSYATSAPGSADNYGNPTPYSTNWFDNNIAGPQAMGSAMVMATSVFNSSELALAQNYLLNAKKEMPKFTGQNTVDLSIVGVYSAISSASTSDMTSAFNSMNGTVFISHVGTEGIQADHSYQIHGPQLYMGGYGTSYVNDMLRWGSISAGTGYALNSTQQQTVVDYLLDGTQWFIRGQTLDLTADGRQVTFPSYVGAGDGYVNAIQNALALGNYRTSELQVFLSRQQATISAGAANSGSNNLTGNRDFYNSDIMVQQRPAYYASVKVASNRTSNPETGNNQGLKNLYLGDGVNQIMVSGNEYLGIQPAWNWRRLPGTTVEQDSRSLTPTGTFGAVHGTTAFAGGVSDGTHGAETFNHSRFNVNAHKSWFFFDDEEVALGNGINSANSTSEVDTTINQCLLSTDVLYAISGGTGFATLANKNLSGGDATATPSGLKWVYQGGVGYFFTTPVSNATILAQSQTGNWSSLNTAASGSVTDKIFTLYINHGIGFTGGSYGYIAVPGIATSSMSDAAVAAVMDAYLASNPITVLTSNADSNVQGVYQSTLRMTQASFYAGGATLTMNTGATVASSVPSAMILQNSPNTLKLTAGSPQASSGPLNLTLTNVNLSGGAGGSSWFDGMGTAVAGFNLPSGDTAGSSVGITLSNDAKASPTVSLTSNDGATKSTYTVTGPLTLGGNTTFSEDAIASLAFNAAIGGNFAITQAGVGTLTLAGPNTFTGSVTVNGGTLRATNSTALGSGTTLVKSGGVLVVGAAIGNPITLSGGTMSFSSSPLLSGALTAASNTTSTIAIFDPNASDTPINVPFTGTLAGSGNIMLQNATGTTSPDGGQAFRINASNASTFSGTVTLSHNVKGELFGTTSGHTTPAGTGTIILTAGDAAYGNTLYTVTMTGGYSELNLRNNTSGNQIYGNDVQITGMGLAIINPLGSNSTAGTTVTMGNLQIGTGQTLAIYLSSSFVNHPVVFQSVALNGSATFAPKPNGFGSANSTGSDLYLDSITESAPGSSLTMSGLRTLYLEGDSAYTGGTTVMAGTLMLDSGSTLEHSNISITGGTLTGAGGTIVDNIIGDTGETISITGGTINLSNLRLNLHLSGTQTQPFYVLATASNYPSQVTGTFQASTLPSGWGILYNPPSAPNEIILTNPVPEPGCATLLLAAGGTLMLRRRIR